ncbi:hypothetical protein CG709_01925, partial [Lachnotalea glycerini]
MKIPVKSPKKSRKIEDKTLLLIEFQYIEKKERSERLINYYAIQKRMQKGLLAGMWQLPSLEGKKSTLQIKKYLQTFIQ